MPIQVLLAEDNRADVFLVQEAIRAHALEVELHVVEDGEKAIEYIDQADEGREDLTPQLLLLDLNLPRRSGEEILVRLRESRRCGSIPVVIFTSSDSPADRTEALRLGANRYFRKPPSFDEFMKLGEILKELLSAPKAASSA